MRQPLHIAALIVFVGATLLCGAVSGAGPSPATTATVAAETSSRTVGDLQQLLEERVRDSPGVGIIAGVIDHGTTTVYVAGSSGTQRPLDEHTLFQIGSVTKTFTATILASMVLDGSVKLNDPVSKYVPASVHVPSHGGKPITLLNLATQHSGLPRLPTNLDPGAADPYGNYTLANLYTFLNGYTLTRDPGAQFEYSNAGVALLGDALANAKRTNYGQLLQDRVLTPLDMHETAIALQPQRRDRLAAGHDADGNPVPLWTFKAGAPAGAIISSLSDMLKYLRANMLQGPLSKVCLFAQQPRDSIPSAQIGLIWWTNDFTSIINHGGDTNGYHAWIAISPDHLHGVVVLTNGGGPVEDLALHAIDPDLPATVASRDAQLDAAALDGYVGVYNGAQAQTLTISHVGDHLVAQLSDQPAARLYPASKDHFYYRMVPARIDFIRDSQGKAYALVMREQGEALVFTRPGLRTPPPSALAPSYPPVIALDSQTLDEYAGDYFGATTTLHFTVTREGNSLFVQLDDQPAYQVFPASQDHFYYKIVDAQIDFQRDAQGRVNALVLHQNGYDITSLKRVPASPLPVK